MKENLPTSRRGQTLVEALIALSILTTGMIGITTLLTKSFQLNRTTSDDTQATYLAAEGIEVAKSLIDHDVYEQLSGDNAYGWGTCFGLGPGEAGYYELAYDTIDDATTPCPARSLVPLSDTLYFNPTTDLYSYNSFGATPTDFIRNVKVTDSADGNELDVQSIVTWTNEGLSNTITLEDHFYDWYPSDN
jgi:Prokaryotic N-terminal methylation motif